MNKGFTSHLLQVVETFGLPRVSSSLKFQTFVSVLLLGLKRDVTDSRLELELFASRFVKLTTKDVV